jgi:plastocyanin
MKCEVAIGAMTLLTAWAGFTAGSAGTLVGRIDAKRAAVIFLEGPGKEQFGIPRSKTERLPPATASDTRRATLDQKKLTFIPHVLAIERGTVVDFVNNDDLLHNIHLYRGSDMKTLHNFALPLKGMKLSYRFDVPDEVIVLCDVHSEMSAYILILPNRHFSKVEGGGDVEMKGINPGPYVVKVWREGMKKVEQKTVDIKPGVNVLTLGR